VAFLPYRRESAHAGGKSVNEPGYSAQVLGGKNIKFGFRRKALRHLIMVTRSGHLGGDAKC